MKKYRNTLCLLLVIILMLSTAGCRKRSEDKTQDTVETAGVNEESSTQPETTETEEEIAAEESTAAVEEETETQPAEEKKEPVAETTAPTESGNGNGPNANEGSTGDDEEIL